MEQNEIIASQPESASALSMTATAAAAPAIVTSTPTTTATSPAKVPSSPSTLNKLNNNSKSYTEIHFNAVNKASGNGSPLNHPQRNDRSDRNKSTTEENRRLLSPAPASLQLSKKFVVMPTAIASPSASASSTPSPPYTQANSSRNGANNIINNINNNSSNNYLKPSSAATATAIPTTIVTTFIADSSSTDPSSTTSPIGSPSIAAGARPKHFQSMRSIRSGRFTCIFLT